MCAFASHCTSFTSACAAMFDCHNRPLTHEHRTHQCGRVPPVFAMLVDVGLRVQNAWGLWGVAGSADAMRAPRVGTLLSFYAALGTGSASMDSDVRQALASLAANVSSPATRTAYGIGDVALTSSFVALVLCDMQHFGSTF
eukprot:m.496726 g.496726  ORF g.496726 m.496726 type:complete len:141 (-) comp21809_c0_seq43:419-841(-)